MIHKPRKFFSSLPPLVKKAITSALWPVLSSPVFFLPVFFLPVFFLLVFFYGNAGIFRGNFLFSTAQALELVCDDNGLIEAFSNAYSKELKAWALADPSISTISSDPRITIKIIAKDEPIPFPEQAPLYTLFDSAIGGGGELLLFEKLINPTECFLTIEIKVVVESKEFFANKPFITKIRGSYRLPPKLRNLSHRKGNKRQQKSK